MKERKVRFTIWISPDILRAAKAHAIENEMTVSEVLAAAATAKLGGADRRAGEEKLLQAVERIFSLIRRIDRRRSYDNQVIKEMVGLLAQSFFNHIPAVPEKDKKTALFSGKVRLNRFLDCLAANLRAGDSILNDVPMAELSVGPQTAGESDGVASAHSTPKAPPPPPADTSREVSDAHDHRLAPRTQEDARHNTPRTLFG